MSSATDRLREFFEYIWGDVEGLVYVPTLDKDIIDQKMYQWPKQKETVISYILKETADGKDTFFSPALYEKGPPTKANVLGTNVLWADFDENLPTEFDKIPDPTLRVQSSTKSKQHLYWRLEEFETDIRKIEDANRGIAYTFGADTSGWDATQFLRPPETTNTGHRKDRKPLPVKLASDYGRAVKFEQFNLPNPKAVVNERIDLESIPQIQDVIALVEWPVDMWELFSKAKGDVSDRSAAIQRLAYSGAEAGMSDEQIYSVLHNVDGRWEKYSKRHDQKARLIDCINKARSKVGYNFDDDSVIDALVQSVETKDEPSSTKIVLPFGEFLNEHYEFEWLLEGLITTKGLGLVSGTSGTGKTQLIMQLGSMLASGQDFFVWKNISKQPKRVLFLSLEMDGPPLQLFAKKTAGAYDAGELVQIGRNFIIAPLGMPVQFDTEGGQNLIDNILNQVHPEVVLIDSLSQTLSESATDEVAAKSLMWYVNKHIRQKHGAAVVFIHHNRKEGNIAFSGGPTLEDVYGNTFLTNQLDFGLTLRRTHVEGHLNLFHVKARLAQASDVLALKRTEHLTYLMEDSNEPATSRTTTNKPKPLGPDGSGDTVGEGNLGMAI